MDIYLTHMAKTYLKERLQHEDEEIADTTPADTEDTSLETEEDSTPNVIEKRTASYQGCDITMEEQDEDTLAINYSCGEGYKQVRITYEPKEKYIISFEYL